MIVCRYICSPCMFKCLTRHKLCNLFSYQSVASDAPLVGVCQSLSAQTTHLRKTFNLIFMVNFLGNSHQVPSDRDMNNIIDFLSCTQTPPQLLQPVTSAVPTAHIDISTAALINSNMNHITKQPLSNQHSSPLPASIKPLTGQEPPIINSQQFGFTRHHSDWQLYANSKVSSLRSLTMRVHLHTLMSLSYF